MNDLNDFYKYKNYLFSIAYRILGSVADAEDIIQEVQLKWLNVKKTEIKSLKSWLVTVTSRLSIDQLKSAKVQRESYIGPWLPEPLIEKSPTEQIEIDESISIAVLLLLERLSPSERAAFLLHDVFQYSFQEIAIMLNKTEASSRKLASRARKEIQEKRNRFHVDRESYKKLSSAFFDAVKNGDLELLREILTDDVTLKSDGGGKVAAALRPLPGIELVCNFLIKAISPTFKKAINPQIKYSWFNGFPGYLLYDNTKLVTAYSFEITDNKISQIFALRNPEKLKFFEPNFK